MSWNVARDAQFQTSTPGAKKLSSPMNATLLHLEYSKPGKFAMHTIPAAFSTKPAYGEQNKVVIPAHGDLLCDCLLEVTMTKPASKYPASHACYFPVECLCKGVTISIGDTKLETLDSDYFRLYDTWYRSGDKKDQYKRMTNFDAATINSGQQHLETLYLPLVFGFTHDPALGLPLYLIQEPICLTFDFASAADVGVAVDDFTAVVHCDYITFDAQQARLRKRPAELLLPVVQRHHQTLTSPGASITTNNVMLPFSGVIKNISWVLKDSSPASPLRTKHGRYVGDAAGTYVALQASHHSNSGYANYQTLSEKLAPVYDAALSYNQTYPITHNKGTYFNRAVPLKALGVTCPPGYYYHTFALHPDNLNPSGYIDVLDKLPLWLHLRMKATSSQPLTDAVFAGAGAEKVARNIDHMNHLCVYAEGYQLVQFQQGGAVIAWD